MTKNYVMAMMWHLFEQKMLLNVKNFAKLMMNVIIGLSTDIEIDVVSSKMLMLYQAFLQKVALHLGLKFVVNK